MTQLGFYIDVAKCTGCKACVTACKDKNNLPVGINFRKVQEYCGGSWQQDASGAWTQDVFAYYVSVACNHCADPACVKVCPTGAHFKDKGGLVRIDSAKCIGCGACAAACPYGAPQLNKSLGKMMKCDGCVDRLQAGLMPTCVQACPQRALGFGEIEDLRAQYGDLAAIAPLPSDKKTRPSICIHPARDAKPVDDNTGKMYCNC